MTDELATYFQEAASWDIDRTAQTVKRARIVSMVAGAGWVSTLITSAALALMMPLKTAPARLS